MNKDIICLASQAVELSEFEDHIEITNRVCYYDDPNLNGALLPSEGAEKKAQTLVNKPIVAKYTTNLNGEPTFKGHEMSIDESGEAKFGTSTVGTHVSVSVRDDFVETVSGEHKTLPCLFATSWIWNRNENYVAAAKRLFELGKLYSSWEIVTKEYHYADGIKTITDYSFLSNALLGPEFSYPAYGTASKAVSLSELSNEMPPELMIAEALAKDITINKEQEDDDLIDNKTKKSSVETSDVEDSVKDEIVSKPEASETENVEETKELATENEEAANKNVEAENTETETSALTQWDLHSKIAKAAEEKLNDRWCYVAYHFPNENMVWVKPDGAETELDYVLFTYTVVGDEVTLSEPQNVKLTVAFSEVNSKIDELNNSLVSANETVQNLNSEISALSVYKEKFEQAEQEKIEAEQILKQDEMKKYALSSGLITEEEISSDESIQSMISSLDESAVKALIAERFMASMQEKKQSKEVETSESKEKKQEVKVHLSTDTSEAVSEFRSTFLKKNK